MTQATIAKKLNKTVEEIERLAKQTKRKLLELEVMLSLSDIAAGKVNVYKKAEDFFKTFK